MRRLIPAELEKGFGFIHGKPPSSFSPVAVTADELGAAWDGERLHGKLISTLNSSVHGQPDCGVEMQFGFPRLIAYAAKTRALGAGTIVGSGTVSNADRATGSIKLISRSATGKPAPTRLAASARQSPLRRKRKLNWTTLPRTGAV